MALPGIRFFGVTVHSMGTFGWLNCGLACMILFGLVVYGMVRGWVV